MADPLSNFKNFLFKTWRSIGIPVDPTPLQYDFAEYLSEHVYRRQLMDAALRGDAQARKILMAFRGAAKSYVTTSYSVWRLYLNRDEEVLVTSATDGFAGSIATFAYNMVRNFDWLADMKPRSDQRQSALAFDVNGAKVSKDESFASRSIFGQITGRRATLIIGDDLETPNTSDTETKRQQLRDRVSELGGAIIKPGGDILFLGTAQHEQTIYKEYAEEKGYELRIYPIVYPIPSDDPKLDELRKYGTRLAPLIARALEENPLLAGTSTEPSRFTERDIEGRKLEWGTTEFNRQFKMWLDADGGKGNPLKLRDLICMDISKPSIGKPLKLPSEVHWSTLAQHRITEEGLEVDSLSGDSYLYGPSKADIWVPAEQVICRVDTSGDGEDETSWSIYAGVGALAFLLHQGSSLEGHSEDTLKAIAKDCMEWGVQICQVEKNFGGGMFSSLLRPQFTLLGHVCEVEDILASNQVSKERRIIETMEPVLTGHRLVVNTEVLRRDYHVDYTDVERSKRRFYRLTYQLSRITKQKGCLKHDDRVDSAAGGLSHFAERLQKTLQGAQAEGKARALDIEIEKLIEARRKAGLPLFGLEKEVSQFGRGRGQ